MDGGYCRSFFYICNNQIPFPYDLFGIQFVNLKGCLASPEFMKNKIIIVLMNVFKMIFFPCLNT